MPQAEKTEELTGIITFGIFNSFANDVACIPPPPPKATRLKSLGSYPLLTDTSLSAFIILLLAIRMMPRAVSSLVNFNFLERGAIVLLTASISALISPPQK